MRCPSLRPCVCHLISLMLDRCLNAADNATIFIRPITDNLNAIGHAVGQDSETKSTEHCPKYKQSTVI